VTDEQEITNDKPQCIVDRNIKQYNESM